MDQKMWAKSLLLLGFHLVIVPCTGAFKCPRPNGAFPCEGDCHAYWVCSNSVPYLMKCPNDLNFDPESKVCGPVKCNISVLTTTSTTQENFATTESSPNIITTTATPKSIQMTSLIVNSKENQISSQ